MNKYFYRVSIGLSGCDSTGIIEAETEDQALEYAIEEAIQNAESYGFYQDEEYFGDLDQVGSEWDEDDQWYNQSGYLDYYVELYIPEEHDHCIS